MAALAVTWSRSVDLPTPGSPAIRMAEPGTTPPPHTRSNSSIPVSRRAGVSSWAVQAFRIAAWKVCEILPLSGFIARPAGPKKRLLNQGVPGAAAGALPGPFVMDGAAGLADIDGLVAGH